MNNCSNCGNLIKEGGNYCTECGTSSSASSIMETVSPEMIINSLPELNSLKFAGLECLKCGSVSNLTLFTQAEIVRTEHRRSTSYRTKSINVPLCEQCNSDISNWIQKHKGVKSRNSYKDVGWLTFCGLIIGIGLFSSYPLGSLLIFIAMALSYAYMIYKMRLKKEDNSPFRYIKFRLSNTFVNPKGKGDWIKYDLWLNQITKQNQFAF